MAQNSCEMNIVLDDDLPAPLGQPIEFTFVLSSSKEASVYMHDNALCNLSFMVWGDESPDALFSRRVCVAGQDEMPNTEYEEWGPGKNNRSHYFYSPLQKITLTPARPRSFTLAATTSARESGTITVMFADDVYFEFNGPTTISVFQSAQQLKYLDDGEGGFGAFFNISAIQENDQISIEVRPGSTDSTKTQNRE